MITQPNDLITLLRTRLDMLRSLRSLSEEQLEFIRSDRLVEADGVVEIKDAVVLRLESWERLNAKTLKNLESENADPGPEIYRLCRELRQAAEREWANFQALESESRIRLREQRDRISSELTSMAQGAQTLSAYEDSSSTSIRLTFDVDR